MNFRYFGFNFRRDLRMKSTSRLNTIFVINIRDNALRRNLFSAIKRWQSRWVRITIITQK